MLEKIAVDKLKDRFPFLIYQRINLIPNSRGPFFFVINSGYWYIIRHIRCQWAEVAAGVAPAFNPGMNIEIRGSGRHREYQNAPVPLRLLSSPCGNGVTLTAPAGMTATGTESVKMIDELLPQRENIEIYLSGHDATPFPAFIDILLVGYMIPDEKMVQFKGGN